MKNEFHAMRWIIVTPDGKSMVNAIGNTQTDAFEKACTELGNRNTVDRLKNHGYSAIEVQLKQVTR